MRQAFMICLIWPVMVFSQDSAEQKKLTVNGYLKELATYTLPNELAGAQFTNLVHNRLNLRYRANERFSAALELRNLFFWGDAVKADPAFTRHLRNLQELTNLSAVWHEDRSAAVQSNVERLWVNWQQGKWTARLGRQRINWGVNNVWNPNDIFNAYNLLDFDYEERAGTDAVKLQYHVGELSTLEAAVARGLNGTTTVAAKYSLNRDRYDWQIITGTYNRKLTAGLAWSGHLGKAGFKGEGQAFYRKDSLVLNFSTEVDYITPKGWYLNAAFLYNQLGMDGPIDDWSGFSFRNRPDNLMPTRWNFLVGSSKAFTPLFSGSLSVIYAPGTNMLVLFPTFTYNLATDLDLDLVWQSFFAESPRGFESLVNQGFLRFKWSF